MFIWVGPRWMGPGTRFSKIAFTISVPLAIFMIVIAWTSFRHGTHSHLYPTTIFRVLWTALLIAIEAFNFYTWVLARGPYARRILAAADKSPAK